MIPRGVAPLLLSSGIALLTVAWLFGNPPASAPDEPEHYLRAVSIGRGEILGQTTIETPMSPQNDAQAVLLRQITRSVEVPLNLAVPQSWFCTVVDHEGSAGCLRSGSPAMEGDRQLTYVGSYQPFMYAFPALLTRLASDPVQALYLARIGFALLAASLLMLALALVWDPQSATSLVGYTLAVTPTVLFTTAVISPSAVEVAGGICIWTAVVRAWRQPRAAGLAIVALGVAGFAVGIGRPLGPVWIAFAGLGILMLPERVGLSMLWRAHRTGLLLAGSAVAVAVSINLAWQFTVLPPAPRHLGAIIGFLGPSLASVPEAIGEVIGVFGWQDTLMPRPWYGVWGLLVVAIVAVALMRGRHRELRRLEAILLAAGALVVLISAAILLPTGFAVQGRYILPALSAVPIIAGEVIRRNEERISSRGLVALVVAASIGVTSVHFVGWYSNAHKYAVGIHGPWIFISQSQWQPPLGWLPWLTLAGVGAVLIGASGLISVGATNEVLPRQKDAQNEQAADRHQNERG